MKESFKNKKDVVLVQKLLAAESGQGELLVCICSDCSTVSKEWVPAVTQSGRLPTNKVKWDKVQPIEF